MKEIKGVTLKEAIKDMTPEELEKFKKERYEKFIVPLMNENIRILKNKLDDK